MRASQNEKINAAKIKMITSSNVWPMGRVLLDKVHELFTLPRAIYF